MPVNEVKMYRTSDGETFELYQSACNHELSCTMRGLIEAEIRQGVDVNSALDWTPVEMAKWITDHIDALKKIEIEAFRISGVHR